MQKIGFKQIVKFVQPRRDVSLLNQTDRTKHLSIEELSSEIVTPGTTTRELKILYQMPFQDIVLPNPTQNKVNALKYEVHPIGKKCTDEPNTLGTLIYGSKKALLLDPNLGCFQLYNIASIGINVEIAFILNSCYIRQRRNVNILSMKYRPFPYTDVQDEDQHRGSSIGIF